MKTDGEYLFNSATEIVEFLVKPTNYELHKGITITGHKLLNISDELKICLLAKSDNTETLYILFRNSIKYDIWKFWCPSESQANLLPVLSEIYITLDKRNTYNRSNKC